MVQGIPESFRESCGRRFIFQDCVLLILMGARTLSELDSKDLLIMSHLRNNARKNLTNISKETRIPVSTLFNRLKTFESTYIRRHTAILDFSKLGYGAVANIMIKVNKAQKIELGAFLKKNRNINSLVKITNGYDFIVEGVFESIFELEDFLETLDERFKILKKDVYYVIEDIKREEFLADHALLSMINF